jgi:hypothetical protein
MPRFQPQHSGPASLLVPGPSRRAVLLIANTTSLAGRAKASPFAAALAATPGGPRWTPLRPSLPCAAHNCYVIPAALCCSPSSEMRKTRIACILRSITLVRLCLSGPSSRLATAHLTVVPRPCGSSNSTSSREAPALAPAAELSTPCYSRQCPRHTLAANCSSVSAVTVFPITNA